MESINQIIKITTGVQHLLSSVKLALNWREMFFLYLLLSVAESMLDREEEKKDSALTFAVTRSIQ